MCRGINLIFKFPFSWYVELPSGKTVNFFFLKITLDKNSFSCYDIFRI